MIAAMRNMMVAIALAAAGTSFAGMAGATTVAFSNIGADGAYDLKSGAHFGREPFEWGAASFSFKAQASGQIKNIGLALSLLSPDAKRVDMRLALYKGNLGLGTGQGSLGATEQSVFSRGSAADSYALTSFSDFSAYVTKGGTYTLFATLTGSRQSCWDSQNAFDCNVRWHEALSGGEGAAGTAQYFKDIVGFDPDTELATMVSIVPLPAPIFLLFGGLGLLGLVSRRAVAS